MPAAAQTWEPCLADAQRGVAFFDGVRIEADRITSPRWTRVLPVLEEEQVSMCRALRQRGRLQPGMRVLDLGTGSGVMAIWAAIHGCEVVAVDISPRAIRLAKYNEEFNAGQIKKGGGKIEWIRRDAAKFAEDPANDSRFDVVLLTPPYNPTVPGLHPARHAFGGPDGMEAFSAQMPLAARMVRSDGFIIGNQMAFHDKGKAAAWWSKQLRRIERVFGASLGVEYASMLEQKECLGETFLRGQYKHYLDRRLQLTPGPEAVEAYIDNLLGPANKPKVFALYYYEISCAAPQADSAASSVVEFDLAALPERSWRDRISLHQTIVDHTASQNTFQTPTLFLDNAYALPVPNAAAVTAAKGDTSPLRALPKWIAQAEIFSGENAFDFLLIDAAPWYSSPEGRRGLHNDVHLYASEAFLRQAGLDPLNLIRRYQEVVANIQRLGQGPFMHPLFTGQAAPDVVGDGPPQDWGLVYFRVADGSSAIPGDLDDPVEATGWRILQSDWNWKQVTPLAGASTPAEGAPWDGFRVCHAAASLEQLDTDPGQALGRLRRLGEALQRAKIDRPQLEIAQTDLGVLYMGYHARLRTLFGLDGDDATKTLLTALPLRLSTAEPAAGRLPDSFRGGVFAFAGTRGKIAAQDEARLIDVVRLAVLLESAEIDLLAMNALRESVERAYHSEFAHEVKRVVSAISAEMSRNALEEIRAYFYMLVIFPEEFQRHDAEDIWLDVRGNMPLNFGRGETLRQFIDNHAEVAFRIRRMLVVHRRGRESAPPKPPMAWGAIKDKWVAPEFAPKPPASGSSVSGPPDRLLELCAFGAALVAAFRNLFEHQDPTRNKVEISCDGDRVRLVNHMKPSSRTLRSGEAVGDRKWSTAGVLAQLAARYGRRDAVRFCADPTAPDDRWITEIPLPPGFLIDATLPD